MQTERTLGEHIAEQIKASLSRRGIETYDNSNYAQMILDSL